MKPKIYVASPYSKGDREENVKRSIMACELLWKNGFIPYCPLLSHFWDLYAPHSWDEWMNYDLEWLHVCDGVYLLPGESNGAQIEVDAADKAWIPVWIEGESDPIEDMIEYFSSLAECQ